MSVLQLATFFFGAGGSDEPKRSGENVGSIMCASAARSPSVVRLSQAGSSSVRVATDTGRRYVRYGYDSGRLRERLDRRASLREDFSTLERMACVHR